MRSSPDAKTKVVISETVDFVYPMAYAKENERHMDNCKHPVFEGDFKLSSG